MEIWVFFSEMYNNMASAEGASWSGAFWWTATYFTSSLVLVGTVIYAAWLWVDDANIDWDDVISFPFVAGFFIACTAMAGFLITELIRWLILNIPVIYFLAFTGFIVGMFSIRKFRRFAKIVQKHVGNTEVHKKADTASQETLDEFLARSKLEAYKEELRRRAGVL